LFCILRTLLIYFISSSHIGGVLVKQEFLVEDQLVNGV